MNTEMSPRVRLLDDAPSSEDAFGSHQKLASALADILTEEQGGKAIALEGSWGSGKSTVVKLLNKTLIDNPNQSLLVFDAWAHEGDPLRRTFLENLISHLTVEGWVSEKSGIRDERNLQGEER